AIDILKTFRFSLGEYFFPMVDWKFHGFRASGQSDQMTFSGTICDLTKPFILDGVIGSYNYTFEYFPSNQGQQGAMTYEGGSGDLIGSGSGVYEVKNLNSGSPTLEVNTMGCLTIMGTLNSCKPTQDTITLTPLETDECGSE
ncbi:MAG: hypothetical protein K8J31_28785, partial [Anaerolineae bacterium]|nr:hypothetical protein [Anaerolineae bacterium]